MLYSLSRRIETAENKWRFYKRRLQFIHIHLLIK